MADSDDLYELASYLEQDLYSLSTGRLTGAHSTPPSHQPAPAMSSPTVRDEGWPHGGAACEMFIDQITTFVKGRPVDCEAPYIAPEFVTDKLEVAIENAAAGIHHHPKSFAPACKYMKQVSEQLICYEWLYCLHLRHPSLHTL